MVIAREYLEGHMNIKFLIRHGVVVEKIEIEHFCVANFREGFDSSRSAPPSFSAGLVAVSSLSVCH